MPIRKNRRKLNRRPDKRVKELEQVVFSHWLLFQDFLKEIKEIHKFRDMSIEALDQLSKDVDAGLLAVAEGANSALEILTEAVNKNIRSIKKINAKLEDAEGDVIHLRHKVNRRERKESNRYVTPVDI